MNRWMLLFVLSAILCAGGDYQSSMAQIPNPGFETWVAGNPEGWFTSNQPGLLMNVTQSGDAHSGASSARGDVMDFFGFPLAPSIITGPDGEGFPVNTREEAVHGWYKFAPNGTDQFFVVIGMSLQDSTIGAGGFLTTEPQPVYREFVANFSYGGSEIPDTCVIAVFISGSGFPTLGSAFWVDDIAFGPAVVSVDENGNLLPDEYALLQNYPNPFNPTTLIQYAIPRSGRVDLRVYDMLGREVATLVAGYQEAGSYRVEFNGADLPSGAYFYRLQSGEFSQVRSLILVK